MDKLFSYETNNSTEVIENATFNSTSTMFQTTTGFPAKQSIRAGIVSAVGLVVAIVGICGNSTVLAVLIRARRHAGNTTHILIANQSAMDLFACVFGVGTMAMLASDYRYNGNAVVDATLCLIFEEGITLATFETMYSIILPYNNILIANIWNDGIFIHGNRYKMELRQHWK